MLQGDRRFTAKAVVSVMVEVTCFLCSRAFSLSSSPLPAGRQVLSLGLQHCQQYYVADFALYSSILSGGGEAWAICAP